MAGFLPDRTPGVPRPTFDLQSHSLHSDGALPAAEVVRLAAEAGVELLALSDHDTVDGVAEARTAAQQHGIRLVDAVEISSVQDEYEDLHVLGYGIDVGDEHLLAQLRRYREDRVTRADRMAEALREHGFELDTTVIEERKRAGKPVGRPHLAQAAFGHPANAELVREQGFADFSDLLVAYLIPNKPAYRKRTFPTVQEAIDLIHAAGGVAVWAHPYWDIDADPAVLASLDRFREWGLDGVEAFYVTHTREQTVLLDDYATQHGLLTTGSSDFHGPGHKLFDKFLVHDLFGRTANLGPIAG
jgi:3',5'-nucleoside bisphosphate phosphatase